MYVKSLVPIDTVMIFDLANALWPMNAAAAVSTHPKASLETEFSYDDDVLTLNEVASRVVLFDDDIHTLDEVIFQLMKATGCPEHQAEAITWEVHTRGRAVAYEGELMVCLGVSSVLEEIALNTQVLT